MAMVNGVVEMTQEQQDEDSYMNKQSWLLIVLLTRHSIFLPSPLPPLLDELSAGDESFRARQQLETLLS